MLQAKRDLCWIESNTMPGAPPARRHAKNAAAPIDQSREAHRSARPLHAPRGGSRKMHRRQFRFSGCHRLIHPNVLVLLDALSPAEMEPEVGFEPTTFRLRVEKHPSSRCQPGLFWLLTSAGSSVECVPDLPCYGRGNDQENDQAVSRKSHRTMAIFRSGLEGSSLSETLTAGSADQ